MASSTSDCLYVRCSRLPRRSWASVTCAWWSALAVSCTQRPCSHQRYTTHYTLHTAHYTLHTTHYILHNAQSTLRIHNARTPHIQVARRGVPVAEFNMETTPATRRLGGRGFFFQVHNAPPSSCIPFTPDSGLEYHVSSPTLHGNSGTKFIKLF